jgi:hypothetical protein
MKPVVPYNHTGRARIACSPPNQLSRRPLKNECHSNNQYKLNGKWANPSAPWFRVLSAVAISLNLKLNLEMSGSRGKFLAQLYAFKLLKIAGGSAGKLFPHPRNTPSMLWLTVANGY